MTLEKGDFILINYTAKVKETNEVFDTTIEEIAKKEHLHKEGELYEPKLVVIGENWVLKALDESLSTMSLNKAQTKPSDHETQKKLGAFPSNNSYPKTSTTLP
jgi:FKBP-type peptidyl-prolyl cis-trans isomerase 2